MVARLVTATHSVAARRQLTAQQRTAQQRRPARQGHLRDGIFDALNMLQDLDLRRLATEVMDGMPVRVAVEQATAPILARLSQAITDLLVEEMPREVQAGIRAGLRTVSAKAARATLNVNALFDVHQAETLEWVRSQAATLVAGITDDMLREIKAALWDLISLGELSLDETVERMMSTVMPKLGLHERWARAVANYADRLTQAVDRTDPRRAEQAARNAKLVEAYRQRLLRARAETIAHTETMRAHNYGNDIVFRDARDRGLVDARAAKVWVTGPSSGTLRGVMICPLCYPMRDKRVRVGHPFVTPNGPVDFPPLHPRCRCSIALDPQGLAADESGDETITQPDTWKVRVEQMLDEVDPEVLTQYVDSDERRNHVTRQILAAGEIINNEIERRAREASGYSMRQLQDMYRRLCKERFGLTAYALARQYKYKEGLAEYLVARHDAYKKVMGELTPLATSDDLDDAWTINDPLAQRHTEFAISHYPASLIRQIGRDYKVSVSADATRGYTLKSTQAPRIIVVYSGADDDFPNITSGSMWSTALHELAHVIQSIPELNIADYNYFVSRVRHDGKFEKPVLSADFGEWTYADQWGDAYAGRTHGGQQSSDPLQPDRGSEVLAVGAQNAISGYSGHGLHDPDLGSYALGALAWAGRRYDKMMR